MNTRPGLLDGASAAALADRARKGELSAKEIADAFLAQFPGEQANPADADQLHAWQVIDPEGLHAQARALDDVPQAARQGMPLFGVPVAIKDNFDTADLPTAYGSPIYAGHRPDADADAVARLRQAGALIAGKVKCAEFAWMTPPDTLNPLDHARTPGGSSNGSAAAVAAGHVPLATGSQTAGSINRPASYCGVYGYKPSFGLLPREGVKVMGPSLDTVGLFARSADDLELAARAIAGAEWDATATPDGETKRPRIAFAPTDLWDEIDRDAAVAMLAALKQAAGRGIAVEHVNLRGYAALAQAQETIQAYESARSLEPERAAHSDQLSEGLRAALDAGAAIPTERYEQAKQRVAADGPALLHAIRPFGAVITPSTDGVPPVGLAFTGNPLFCRVWTVLGAPSVSVPLAWTADPLPAGLQLVAHPGTDAKLLAAVRHLV